MSPERVHESLQTKVAEMAEQPSVGQEIAEFLRDEGMSIENAHLQLSELGYYPLRHPDDPDTLVLMKDRSTPDRYPQSPAHGESVKVNWSLNK